MSTILALKIAHIFDQSVHDIFVLEEADWECEYILNSLEEAKAEIKLSIDKLNE